MIYEYNEKERIVKIDNRTVYLTPRENKIFKITREKGYITTEEVGDILCNGQSTTSFAENFIKRLSQKLGLQIDLRL